jgi:hypothetical protein
MRRRCVFFAVTVSALGGGCARHEPPSWDAATPPLASESTATARAGSGGGADAAGITDAGVVADAAEGGAGALDGAAATPAVDPATLPQTRDKPEASGPAFDARVQALWDAIVKDDPDRALPFFFPLPAYEQVKAIQNPAADWKRRLVAAYARDIHDLHKKLGKDPEAAKLVRFDAGPAPRWVEPNEEYNKIGYWRVFGSKLRWEREGGKAEAIDVKSLISWRGEWFVVHLSAIK